MCRVVSFSAYPRPTLYPRLAGEFLGDGEGYGEEGCSVGKPAFYSTFQCVQGSAALRVSALFSISYLFPQLPPDLSLTLLPINLKK